MQIVVRNFQIPKKGNTLQECEDAFYPDIIGTHSENNFSFAIADGSTVGMLSKQWAKILVETYCNYSKDNNLEMDSKVIVKKAQDYWAKWKEEYINNRQTQGNPIKWYEENGLETGAFSTLLGFTLQDNNKWYSIALGDSCLFQIRDDEVVSSFPIPIDSWDKFQNNPLLICSNPINNKNVIASFEKGEGDWQSGDMFYLMTDAMAHWFSYLKTQDGKQPWVMISKIFQQKEQTFSEENNFIENWVNDDIRTEFFVKNDDMSVLQIEIQ